MSTVYLASPVLKVQAVKIYVVITVQAAAHFFSSLPWTHHTTGRRGNQTQSMGKPPPGLCFPVLGSLCAGSPVIMPENSSEWSLFSDTWDKVRSSPAFVRFILPRPLTRRHNHAFLLYWFTYSERQLIDQHGGEQLRLKERRKVASEYSN